MQQVNVTPLPFAGVTINTSSFCAGYNKVQIEPLPVKQLTDTTLIFDDFPSRSVWVFSLLADPEELALLL
jgi:hypothetical protein